MANEQAAADVRKQMVEHIDRMVKYWAEQPGLSVEDRCDGVAFSVLTMLDGATDVPAMVLVTTSEAGETVIVNETCELHEIYAELRRNEIRQKV